MRTLRTLAALGALAVLAPATADAQSVGRDFNNSWFWGAKGGIMTFWTPNVAHAPAPTIGAEWLITRRNTALNLAFDQAFFDETSRYTAFDFATEDGNRNVVGEGSARIRDMRRVSAQLFAFPRTYGAFRPYLGGGLALNLIQSADEAGTNPGGDTEYSIDRMKTRGAALITGGVQAQVSRVSLFTQGTVMPAKSNFFFSGGETLFLEFGVRYNVGTSMAR